MAINVFPVDAVAGVPEYTGRELRQVFAATVDGATAARPLGARSGVRKGTAPTTVATSGGNWTVGPHIGILDLQAAVEASAYYYAIDATTTPSAIDAANATHPRKDIVYVTLDDPAESDGSSVPAVTVGYDAGTAAASPSAPATPARSMVLAEINVPNVAGGGASSATVTWVAPTVVAAGGIIPVATTTVRDTLNASATATNPIVVDVLSTGALQRNVGSGWVTLNERYVVQDAGTAGAMPAGSIPLIQAFVIETATDAAGVINISFPETFAAPPIVQATTVSGTSVAVVIASGVVSTTGCRLFWNGVLSTTVRAHVTAIGWRP